MCNETCRKRFEQLLREEPRMKEAADRLDEFIVKKMKEAEAHRSKIVARRKRSVRAMSPVPI